MESIPNLLLLPETKPSPAGDPTATAHFPRKLAPLDSGPEHEQNPGQSFAISKWGASSVQLVFGSRKQGRNRLPQRVRYLFRSHFFCYDNNPWTSSHPDVSLMVLKWVLSVAASTIRKWIKKKVDNAHSSSSETQRLRRENQLLKEIVANFILKEVVGEKNERRS
jgi:hypothetical protein